MRSRVLSEPRQDYGTKFQEVRCSSVSAGGRREDLAGNGVVYRCFPI